MGARPWRCPSDPATAIKRFIKNTLPPCHHCTHTMHVAWQSIVCKGRAGPDHDWQRSRPTLNGASGVPIARKIVAAACLRRKDPCHGATPPPGAAWQLAAYPGATDRQCSATITLPARAFPPAPDWLGDAHVCSTLGVQCGVHRENATHARMCCVRRQALTRHRRAPGRQHVGRLLCSPPHSPRSTGAGLPL